MVALGGEVVSYERGTQVDKIKTWFLHLSKWSASALCHHTRDSYKRQVPGPRLESTL